jgi:glycogen debranching enzyme
MERAEHESKVRILTQHEPAKITKSSDALVLKHGTVFLVATESGDIPFDLPHGYGLFFKDCRFLDGYALSLDGEPLTVLTGVAARGFETRHHLANPELRQGDTLIPRNTIAVRRQRLLRGGVVHELMSVRNFGARPARFSLELRVRARFEDVFVVKGFVPHTPGTLRPPRVVDKDRLELGYDGKDGLVRTTTLVFAPAPAHLEGDRAVFELTLAREESCDIAITIRPAQSERTASARDAAHPQTTPAVLTRWLERAEQIWMEGSATVSGSNPLFNRVFRRALLDLRLLRSQLDGLDYFAAGIPWFATLFGRDAATAAVQTLPYGTAMARQTLLLLARYQATAVDEYRDATPGKILHEFREGELAHIGALPQSPAYYGTVDATMLFLVLMAEYVNWSGDLHLARQLRPNIDAALRWMAEDADGDGDGYVDYAGRYARGLVNQGLKDSGNAIRGAAHRAVRGAGVRVPGVAADRDVAPAARGAREGGRPRAPCRRAPRALQPRLLERRARLLRPRAPGGGTAGRRRRVERGSGAVGRHRDGPAGGAGGGATDATGHVLGMGDPHAVGPRGGLQSDRLSPRHGVAARQQPDPRQLPSLPPRCGGARGLRRPLRRGLPLPRVPAPRALLRPRSARERGRAHPLPGRLQPAGVGGREPAVRALEPARPRGGRDARTARGTPAAAAELARVRRDPRHPRGRRDRGRAVPSRGRWHPGARGGRARSAAGGAHRGRGQ